MADLGGITPQDVQAGMGAFKTAVETVRGAFGLWKEMRGSGSKPSREADEKLERVLLDAEVAVKIAEAQIAKALGFVLCKCQFPPTPMLTVGYLRNGRKVFECPTCGLDTAAPGSYERTAPRRAKRRSTQSRHKNV